MTRSVFVKAIAASLLLLLLATRPLQGGFITFSGDLAGALGGPILTPTTIGAGMTSTFHFDSGDVANVGHVIGDVVLANNAAGTAGSITVTNFSIVSEKPPGSGPIGFSIAVGQDFAYGGLPQVGGSESLGGSYTFAAGLQSGFTSMSSAVNSFALSPFLVTGLSGPPPFPQSVPIDPAPPADLMVASTMPMHLDLILGVSLSNNAAANGPRVDLANAMVGYASIPEPGSLALASLGAVLTGLMCLWRRHKGEGVGNPDRFAVQG